MKETLINHFLQKYNPLAIILHGSRVNGHFHDQSDWDFMFVLEKDNLSLRRSIVFGQNCEAKKLIYPLSDESVEAICWYLREGNAEVLFDTNNIGKEILEKGRIIAKYSHKLSNEDKSEWAAFLLNSINSMKAYKDDPIAFFIKVTDFYKRAISLWFQIYKQWKGPPQVYESLQMIKKEDREMYNDLLAIAHSDSSIEEKINTSENIYKRLFNIL